MSNDTRFTLAVLFVCVCVSVIAHTCMSDQFALLIREQITFGVQVVLVFVMPALYIAFLSFLVRGSWVLFVPKKTH